MVGCDAETEARRRRTASEARERPTSRLRGDGPVEYQPGSAGQQRRSQCPRRTRRGLDDRAVEPVGDQADLVVDRRGCRTLNRRRDVAPETARARAGGSPAGSPCPLPSLSASATARRPVGADAELGRGDREAPPLPANTTAGVFASCSLRRVSSATAARGLSPPTLTPAISDPACERPGRAWPREADRAARAPSDGSRHSLPTAQVASRTTGARRDTCAAVKSCVLTKPASYRHRRARPEAGRLWPRSRSVGRSRP